MKHLEIHVMNQINREEVRILRGQKNFCKGHNDDRV